MALETTPEVVLATLDARAMAEHHSAADRLREAGQQLRPIVRQLRCPVLVVAGALDVVELSESAVDPAGDTPAVLDFD